jgi:hypothetical protein
MIPNLALYIAAIIGAILYMGFDFIGKKGDSVFEKRYIFTTIINILAGCALIWISQLKEGIMQVGWFDAARLIAVSFGVGGQKLFKSVVDMMDKKVETTIGLKK